MEFWWILLIFICGILVGFVNTIAGSGSFLTLPLLIEAGLPAPIANGSNRVSILLQTITGLLTFRKEKMLDLRNALFLSITVIPGAIGGAIVATDIPKDQMEKVIGFIMVGFLLVSLLAPSKLLKEQEHKENIRLRLWHYIIFLFIGIYGGFIQAGVGIFMLFGLVLGPGYDLVRANAIKLFLTCIFTPFALIVYIYNDQVEWTPALILAGGSMIGAYLGARFAVKKGSAAIRWLLIFIIAATATKMIFF